MVTIYDQAREEHEKLKQARSFVLRGYDVRITNPKKYQNSQIKRIVEIIRKMEKEMHRLEAQLQLAFVPKEDLSLSAAKRRLNLK